jgi:hypothetical protein
MSLPLITLIILTNDEVTPRARGLALLSLNERQAFSKPVWRFSKACFCSVTEMGDYSALIDASTVASNVVQRSEQSGIVVISSPCVRRALAFVAPCICNLNGTTTRGAPLEYVMI